MTRKRQSSTQTLALLSELLTKPRTWQYGYDLSKRTQLKSGTLYPILMRLSDRGLLESKWVAPQTEGRPARHAYRLTSSGVAFARDEIKSRDAVATSAAPKVRPA